MIDEAVTSIIRGYTYYAVVNTSIDVLPAPTPSVWNLIRKSHILI